MSKMRTAGAALERLGELLGEERALLGGELDERLKNVDPYTGMRRN